MTFKVKDYYFKKAKQKNYLARSIFKLEEIDQKYKILNRGDQVVDLGYFPGSWTQYASERVGEKGHVTGIDIQPVNKKITGLKNVTLKQQSILDLFELEDFGQENVFDVVLSDMAPKTTGIKTVDQARSLELIEQIYLLLPKILKIGGHLVIKVFESQDSQKFFKDHKNLFKQFYYLKPKSTRSISKEIFAICKSYSP